MVWLRGVNGAFAWMVLALSCLVAADCECGYSVNKPTDATYDVFTDLLEDDFLHASGTNATMYGWQPQEYNVSAKDSRGPFGKSFEVANVELNPLKSSDAWSGPSQNGGDAGLQLWVRSDHAHGHVGSAEVATLRKDALYGSFRVGMKMAAQSGTCGAFFWFYNNSQEIDIEFLSSQFNGSQGTVQLVLQSPQSVQDGYDAAGTPGYQVEHLPFRPDEQFHEYRFDWSPDRVIFFVDGKIMHEMKQGIPDSGGHMFMNHWSNGDPKWSAGPPAEDTAMTVSYVKAYFNSTDTARTLSHKRMCPTFDASKVCQIPEQTVAPDGENAKTYFFTLDGDNRTPGQTVYHANGGAAMLPTALYMTYTSILIGVFIWACC